MGIVNKDGAAIYKFLNLNQIDKGVKNAKKRSVLRRWLQEKRPKARSLGRFVVRPVRQAVANHPKSGSCPAATSWLCGRHGGKGRVILATT